VRLFDWLGGVVRGCVYYNLRSAVAKRDGEEVGWSARFLHLRRHYAFHATACTPTCRARRAWSRGRCAI
jgi:hypothetical protein